jgi:YidC/Oxa1 family membrane protein insertase
MDKKNTTIGVILLLAALAVGVFGPKSAPPTNTRNAQVATSPGIPSVQTPATGSSNATASNPTPTNAAAPNDTFAAINSDAAEAKVITLANDVIEARLTNFGGAIREVAFKKFPAIEGKPEPYVFNHLHEDPLLAFTDYPGLGRDVRYEVVSATSTEVIYRAVLDGKIEVTRRYQLSDPNSPNADPYRLHHETTFRNLTNTTIPLPRSALSVGTATLINANDPGLYLNVATYNGTDFIYTDRSELEAGGIGSIVGAGRTVKPVLEKPGAVVWAAVKNQFFASIYTPDQPGVATIARRIELPPFPDSQRPNIGMTAAARFELPALAPNGTATLAGHLYVGPKEYKRLAKFEHNEDGVMQYARGMYRIFLSGYVAPLENTLLNAAHRWLGSWAGSWGVAVILMTLMLKTVSLPFTIAASRSARRMAKLQPELKAMREKYKDNPQKQQTATMELFKQHKVNPLGGCIPVLITMPLFFGFYAMLAGAAELRFQPFLWAADLSAPDTIAHLALGSWMTIPVNIMPLLMGGTMIFQMRLTPQPAVDNTQATMMKFMPVIFIVFCYNFSCALALYSTINGLFTIGQQLVINRMRDDGDPAAQPASPGGKPMKNITPGKKGLKG